MVSVFLVVLQTSFSVTDEAWGERWSQPSNYEDNNLTYFKTAVANKSDKSIKIHLSMLFPRLYKGQSMNNRYIEKNKDRASEIKERSEKDLTGWFARISLRRSLSQYRELLSYHFDCADEWLNKRIKILNEAKTKEEQNKIQEDRKITKLLAEIDTLNTKVKAARGDVQKMDQVSKDIETIKNVLNDEKTTPDNSKQNENTSGHTESDWFTDWLTKLITLKTKVDAARKEVEELNKGRKHIEDIKHLVKNKEEISENTKQIGEHVQKIVGINEKSQLTKLTSDVIDYLKEISGRDSEYIPPDYSSDSYLSLSTIGRR